MTEFEKATYRFMKRLHDAMENMYIYYDGDKQISKEEFESKFNTLSTESEETMTNEKAIKHLEVIKGDCALVGDIRALDMGISALSESNTDKLLNEFVEFLIKETCQGCKRCTPGVDDKGCVCLHQGEAVWYRDMIERFKEVTANEQKT